MIEANKQRHIEWIFRRINLRMLRSTFHAVHAAGDDALETLDRNRPIIFIGNHSNWWDGLIAFHLSTDLFGLDAHVMMDEEQMRRYSFFRWIGAFSVNRRVPREAFRSLWYAASLFDRPNRALWMYPQGKMLPNDSRPMTFERGILRLIDSLPGLQIIPIASRYEFLMEQKAEAFVSIGTPILPPAGLLDKDRLAHLEQSLAALLDDLRTRIAAGNTGSFRTTLRGRTSANVRFDKLRSTLQNP
jgi:1-acyl-sn-glycerol-3-phosphate acyltransferase